MKNVKKKYRYLGIIPARGGSKGLPGKNIVSLGGKPLIQYTIEDAQQSKLLDHFVVSTDDESIKHVSENCGSEVIVRPKEFARDNSPSSEAVLHAVECLKAKGKIFDVIVLLEPTSPLRRDDDIDCALQIFEDHGTADALVSVGQIMLESPFAAKDISSGYVKAIIETKENIFQRQMAPKAYFPYGVIYLSKLDTYAMTKTFYQEKTIPYLIERWQNYEIDDTCDLHAVHAVMKLRGIAQ